MNDTQLTKLLKDDPQKGFEAVIRQYSAYVMKIAYTRLRDVCTREDIELWSARHPFPRHLPPRF